MVGFNRETDAARLDYQLLMRGPVRLIHGRTLLSTTVEWLRRHDYEVLTIDAAWLITPHMFRDLGSAFGYACHDNWQCLGEGIDEALAEVWRRTACFALVLTSFDVFERDHRDDAHTLLEVVAERAWPAALLGRRLVCLVQSDRLSLNLRRIGMWSVPWFDQQQGSVTARS